MAATISYRARVWEVGVVSGAGPYNLPNVANTGAWRTFATAAPTSGLYVVVCIADTVSYAWELMLATYTAGNPGTIARVATLESSTGSAINFAGNICNITLEIPSPTQVSAGSSTAGLVPATNANGTLDQSMVMGIPCIPGMYLGNDLGASNYVYGNGDSLFTNAAYQTFFPFVWRGTLPIQNVGCFIKTAATSSGTLHVGIMQINGSSISTATATLLTEFTSENALSTTVTGAQSVALPAPYLLTPGLYIMQIAVYASASPSITAIYAPGNISSLLTGSPGGTYSALAHVCWSGGYNQTSLASSVTVTGGTGSLLMPDIQLGM